MPATVSRDTGQMIKQARLKKKMSQEELSKRIEQEVGRPISHTQVSKWETGLLVPRLDMMRALNKILGLFGDEIKEASKPHDQKDVASRPVVRQVADGPIPGTPIAAANPAPSTKRRPSARETLLRFANAFESHEDAAIKSMDGIKREFGSVIFHFNEIRRLNIIHQLGYKNVLEYVEREFGIDRRAYSALAKFQQKYGEKDEHGEYTGELSPESKGSNIIGLLTEIAKDNAYAQQPKAPRQEQPPKQDSGAKTKPTTIRDVCITAGSTMDKIIRILEDMTEKERIDVLSILKPQKIRKETCHEEIRHTQPVR